MSPLPPEAPVKVHTLKGGRHCTCYKGLYVSARWVPVYHDDSQRLAVMSVGSCGLDTARAIRGFISNLLSMLHKYH